MSKPITPAAVAAAQRGDLLNLVAAMTPGGIEAQEAAGQRALCANGAKLPKEILHNPGLTPKILTEKLGFQFNGDADDIFYNVTLPEGWKIVPTDHSMWSNLVDAKGQERAAIFYKAAFYDRSAHISFHRRYFVGGNYDHSAENRKQYTIVDSKDPKNPVFVTEWYTSNYKTPEARALTSETEDRLRKQVNDELNARFPENEDIFAYWD